MSEGWVVGTLYKAAEIKTINNKSVLSFTVKCERDAGDKTFTDYVSVSCYGKDVADWEGMPEGTLVQCSGGRYSARGYEKGGEIKGSLNYNCWTNNIRVLNKATRAATKAAPATTQAKNAANDDAGDDVPF